MISERRLNQQRSLQSRFEMLPAGTLRCSVCWELLGYPDFTDEHLPPKAVRRITGEDFVRNIFICRNCNNQVGTKAQDDLVKLLRAQRLVHGIGDDLPGELTVSGVDESIRVSARLPLHGNVSIRGIPKQNDPIVVQRITDAMTKGRGFSLHLRYQFHHRERASRALLHSAYLLLVRRTDYRYAYSGAGRFIRDLLKGETSAVANYCLTATTLPIPGPVCVVTLRRPKRLAGFLVKVAGQLIPMPFESTGGFSFYERWWKGAHSDLQRMVLVPHMKRMELTGNREDFQAARDLLKYLPLKLDGGPGAQ